MSFGKYSLYKVYLISNILRLTFDSHSCNPREVNESEVRNIGRTDLQTDEIVTNTNTCPSHLILGYKHNYVRF